VESRLVVKGAPELAASCDRAARDVADMRDGFEEAARIVASAASGEAPKLTGALAASVVGEVTGRNLATITSPLVYAVPIHWGVPSHNIAPNPFVTRARDATEDRWMRALEGNAQHVCDQVRGI
jgi:hypothetical protein